jgi:hypothetical protein
MAGRGSGIGQGYTGGLGVTGVGGSATSLRTANPGQLYGPKGGGGVSGLGVHHWLWILVALELGFLVVMRAIVFKSYHAG